MPSFFFKKVSAVALTALALKISQSNQPFSLHTHADALSWFTKDVDRSPKGSLYYWNGQAPVKPAQIEDLPDNITHASIGKSLVVAFSSHDSKLYWWHKSTYVNVTGNDKYIHHAHDLNQSSLREPESEGERTISQPMSIDLSNKIITSESSTKASNSIHSDNVDRSIHDTAAETKETVTHNTFHPMGRVDLNELHLQVKGVKSVLLSPSDTLLVLDQKGTLYETPLLQNTQIINPNNLTPLKGDLSKKKVASVKCSSNHCIALSTYGEAFAWGLSNARGQLGRDGNDTTDTNLPKKVDVTSDKAKAKIVDMACGRAHSILLDSAGKLWAFGDDKWIQLGINDKPWLAQVQWSATPQKIPLPNIGIDEIACGDDHTVVRARDGRLFSWGFGLWGQLGHSGVSERSPDGLVTRYMASQCPHFSLPGIVRGFGDVHGRAVQIAAGQAHTVVLNEDGEAFIFGALGKSDKPNKAPSFHKPVAHPKQLKGVLKGKKIMSVFAGSNGTIVLVDATAN